MITPPTTHLVCPPCSSKAFKNASIGRDKIGNIQNMTKNQQRKILQISQVDLKAEITL